MAADNLRAADKEWVDHGVGSEIQLRIQQANAQALLAIGMLLHEHFHPQPVAHKPLTSAEERAELDALLSNANVVTDARPPTLADEGEIYRPRHMTSSTATMVSSDSQMRSRSS